MAKIYFACSILGGGDTSHYLGILEALKDAGAEVISEIFVHDALNLGGSPLPANEIYERDIEMIQEADAIVAEVSNPSLGVGYELGYAEALRKPTLLLFNADSGKRLSAMLAGNPNPQLQEYRKGEIPVGGIRSFLRTLEVPVTEP